MYSSADVSITPRPMYTADGRKLPDVYTHPAALRDELQQRLGQFPLFKFWGPGAGIESSRWIAHSALHVLEHQRPTLTLVYLPHLDYDLQRFGPNHPAIPAQVAEVDALCGLLIEKARRAGAHVVALSEYGITEVSRPVHINRALRQAGWLKVRVEQGREQLDAGASDAFAVADHQLAHVYVARPELFPKWHRSCASSRASSRSWTKTANAPPVWTIRARANWWPYLHPTAGSPTTIS